MSNSDKRVQRYAELLIEQAKRRRRDIRAMWALENKMKALPKVPTVRIPNNYVNPVTLEPPPTKVIVYQVKDRNTGRTNYYNSKTFWKLVGHTKNDYKLLMFDPKKNIFTNPVTRGGVRARNIQRVRVAKPLSTSVAARKIQGAVRAHLKKKKALKK